MSVTADVRNPHSTLRAFLDKHLPQRTEVADEWLGKLDACSRHGFAVNGSAARVGKALELRIGLDLAEEPAHWHLLGCLPPHDCAALLSAAGYAHRECDPPTGTTDPLLVEWTRASRPASIDSCEREALGTVLTASDMDSVAHWFSERLNVEGRRSLLLRVQNHRSIWPPAGEQYALEDLWQHYLTCGREQLLSLGGRVLLCSTQARHRVCDS